MYYVSVEVDLGLPLLSLHCQLALERLRSEHSLNARFLDWWIMQSTVCGPDKQGCTCIILLEPWVDEVVQLM